jgi:hypothetical protein
MKSYSNHKNTAKEKNKRLLPGQIRLSLPGLSRLKKYFSPLAAKIIKSFCRGVQGGQFFQKAPPLAAGGKYE